MYKLSATFSGLLIAIMVTLNGTLAKHLDDYFSILIIHIVGLLSVSLILIIKKKTFNLKQEVPIYLLSGGAVGVFLVLFNNLCFKNMGVSLTLSLGLLGQSIASVIIDHFGLLGMNTYKFRNEKLVGFFLIFIGIAVMITY